MRYWINPNRPDRIYRTNEVTCWSRLVSGGEWTYHEMTKPALPSEWRYEVTEEELERKAA